jgi:hypothetical protein
MAMNPMTAKNKSQAKQADEDAYTLQLRDGRVILEQRRTPGETSSICGKQVSHSLEFYVEMYCRSSSMRLCSKSRPSDMGGP